MPQQEKENNWDSTEGGPWKVCVCLCGTFPVSDSEGMLKRWPSQACLKVCAGRNSCLQMRAGRLKESEEKDIRILFTQTLMDPNSLSAGGDEFGWRERDGWCLDGCHMEAIWGLERGNDDPWMDENESWGRSMPTTGCDQGGSGSLGGVTCVWGRGRPRAEGLVAGRPTLLLSSSSARVRCSNCTSCSLTDSSRAAALSHCSIHTIQPQGGRGRVLHTSKEASYTWQHRETLRLKHRDLADASDKVL